MGTKPRGGDPFSLEGGKKVVQSTDKKESRGGRGKHAEIARKRGIRGLNQCDLPKRTTALLIWGEGVIQFAR